MNDQENGFQKKDALKNCKSCDIFFKNGCANSYNIASNEKCRKCRKLPSTIKMVELMECPRCLPYSNTIILPVYYTVVIADTL